jgi:hypothetical protein
MYTWQLPWCHFTLQHVYMSSTMMPFYIATWAYAYCHVPILHAKWANVHWHVVILHCKMGTCTLPCGHFTLQYGHMVVTMYCPYFANGHMVVAMCPFYIVTWVHGSCHAKKSSFLLKKASLQVHCTKKIKKLQQPHLSP